MDKDLFSFRLIDLRKERGYRTQNQFANAYNEQFPPKRKDESGGNEKSGILGTIKNYENPNYTKSYPSLDKVLNMCDLLGCDIDYLTGRIDEKKHSTRYIHEYTGLSEKTIEVLHFLNSPAYDKEDEAKHKTIISLINIVLESSYPDALSYRSNERELKRIEESRYPDISIDDIDELPPENAGAICSDPVPFPVENIFSTMFQYISLKDTALSFLNNGKRITISGEAATLASDGEAAIFTVNELKRITIFERIKNQLKTLAEEVKKNG